MKKSLFILGLVLFSTVSAQAVEAPQPKPSRPCTKAELVGNWDMVSVIPVLNKEDPAFYPYQKFAFNRDSSMKVMTSDKPFDAKALAAFKSQPSGINYSLDPKGILTMTWSARPHTEYAICAYILQEVPPEILKKIPAERRAGVPKKGNVTLSFIGRDGKIAFQKVLKKAPHV